MKFDEFVNKIKYLEAHPLKYEKELKKQRKLLNYLCCVRPMKELIYRKKTGVRSQKSEEWDGAWNMGY